MRSTETTPDPAALAKLSIAEMAELVAELRSNKELPLCPYDRRSPDYWTAPDDKPCAVCGQINDPNAPILCRGADTSLFTKAADALERLSQQPAGDGGLRVSQEPLRMLVDSEWLSRHVATDPDLDCEASPPPPSSGSPGEVDDEFSREVDAEAVGWIRDAAKRITGGNCTFVDDDLKILESLAARAVAEGQTDHLHQSVACRCLTQALAASRPAEDGGVVERVQKLAWSIEQQGGLVMAPRDALQHAADLRALLAAQGGRADV